MTSCLRLPDALLNRLPVPAAIKVTIKSLQFSNLTIFPPFAYIKKWNQEVQLVLQALLPFQGIFFLFPLKHTSKNQSSLITFKMVYQISILYNSVERVFIVIVLRSQRFQVSLAWNSLDLFQPGSFYYSPAVGIQCLPQSTFCDRTFLIAWMCDLVRQLPSPIAASYFSQNNNQAFLIQFNECCLRELKGWQVTVPTLPLVTSVSSAKTHSGRHAS